MAVIRLARPLSDARQVAAIYYPYVINTPITFESEPPDGAEMRSRIESVMEKYPWLVCEHDGELMGYAYGSMFRSRSAYNWSVETTVYVREAAHGLGIGSALYSSLTECLRLQGFISAVGVIALPNEDSVYLHEHLGFQKDGVLPKAGFKEGVWHDVGIWWLLLSEPVEDPRDPVMLPAIQNRKDYAMAVKSGESRMKI
ncbi:N-acetyltransferase family protein [Dehalococcoidia bacterium]|nr:N-acetyltransferase family protein [Dehalococcoidia bacterium]